MADTPLKDLPPVNGAGVADLTPTMGRMQAVSDPAAKNFAGLPEIQRGGAAMQEAVFALLGELEYFNHAAPLSIHVTKDGEKGFIIAQAMFPTTAHRLQQHRIWKQQQAGLAGKAAPHG